MPGRFAYLYEVGTRVLTPDGPGKVESIALTPDVAKPYSIRLDIDPNRYQSRPWTWNRQYAESDLVRI